MQLAVLGPLVTLCAMMLIQSCAIPTTGMPNRDPLCEADAVITFSASKDSAETVAAVRRHNAAWRVVCMGV